MYKKQQTTTQLERKTPQRQRTAVTPIVTPVTQSKVNNKQMITWRRQE